MDRPEIGKIYWHTSWGCRVVVERIVGSGPADDGHGYIVHLKRVDGKSPAESGSVALQPIDPE